MKRTRRPYSGIRHNIQRYEKRQRELGIVKVTVRVPANRREDLLQIADQWRKEHLGENGDK